jgi:hypothetical protein
MFGIFDFSNSDTIYLRNFYHEAFMGDRVQEEVREAKVKKVIKAMGDKWVLAKPVKRLVEGA